MRRDAVDIDLDPSSGGWFIKEYRTLPYQPQSAPQPVPTCFLPSLESDQEVTLALSFLLLCLRFDLVELSKQEDGRKMTTS